MHKHSPSWFILSAEATADIGCQALIPAVITTATAMMAVALRWISRLCSRSNHVRLEDCLITAAMLLSVGMTAIIGGEYHIDGGRVKSTDARFARLSTMMKLVFAQSIFYHLSINLVKASFVLQYLRLFPFIEPVTVCCSVLLVVILGAAAWGIFGVIFLCKPVQQYWDITLPGSCMDAEDHFWSTSIIGIVLDWAIWLLPVPAIGRLRLPRRQKIGLILVFGLGVFVCIVSILRLCLVHDAAHRNNVTKAGTLAAIFSMVEVNVAIICASLLVMKPLFVRMFPSIVGEQPYSAREEKRMLRAATGVQLFSAGAGDEEKVVNGDRRDTLVDMGSDGVRLAERQQQQGSKQPGRPYSWPMPSVRSRKRLG
ncbi:hypothetical protein ACN47E_008153 [Coniothyrium glycines]